MLQYLSININKSTRVDHEQKLTRMNTSMSRNKCEESFSRIYSFTKSIYFNCGTSVLKAMKKMFENLLKKCLEK